MDTWGEYSLSPRGRDTAPAPELATFRRRAAAYWIDLALLGFVDRVFEGLTNNLDPGSAPYSIVWCINWLIWFFYFAWPFAHGGQTRGMNLLRIRVVGLDGAALTWRHGILRTIGLFVSSIPLGLGFLGRSGILISKPGTISSPARAG